MALLWSVEAAANRQDLKSIFTVSASYIWRKVLQTDKSAPVGVIRGPLFPEAA